MPLNALNCRLTGALTLQLTFRRKNFALHFVPHHPSSNLQYPSCQKKKIFYRRSSLLRDEGLFGVVRGLGINTDHLGFSWVGFVCYELLAKVRPSGRKKTKREWKNERRKGKRKTKSRWGRRREWENEGEKEREEGLIPLRLRLCARASAVFMAVI